MASSLSACTLSREAASSVDKETEELEVLETETEMKDPLVEDGFTEAEIAGFTSVGAYAELAFDTDGFYDADYLKRMYENEAAELDRITDEAATQKFEEIKGNYSEETVALAAEILETYKEGGLDALETNYDQSQLNSNEELMELLTEIFVPDEFSFNVSGAYCNTDDYDDMSSRGIVLCLCDGQVADILQIVGNYFDVYISASDSGYLNDIYYVYEGQKYRFSSVEECQMVADELLNETDLHSATFTVTDELSFGTIGVNDTQREYVSLKATDGKRECELIFFDDSVPELAEEAANYQIGDSIYVTYQYYNTGFSSFHLLTYNVVDASPFIPASEE